MTDHEYNVLAEIHNEVKKLNLLLTGDGEPSKGLIVRVDRLEQKDASRTKWMFAIGTASVTAVAGWAWSKVTGKS